MKVKNRSDKASRPGIFQAERERLNKIVMEYASPKIKRFYALDHQAYLNGALDQKTKELIGLVASLVLRCDDCIKYHLQVCRNKGVTTPELEEALNVGLVVGGSVTIPHLRRAFEFWAELSGTRD